MRQSLLVGFLIFLCTGCESAPGSGSIDGIDVGLRFELHLENLAADSPSPSQPAARFYTAEAKVDDQGTSQLQIAIVPVAAGTLGVVVNDRGALIHSRLWGSPDFDQDPEAAWENYWRQFQYDGLRTVISEAAAAPDSGSVAEDLYEHVRLMVGTSFIIRRTMALTGAGQMPEPDWYQERAAEFDRIPALLEPMRASVGAAAFDKYSNQAKESADQLRLLAEVASGADPELLRSEVMDFRRRACGGCHGIEGELLGDKGLKDTVLEQLPGEGVTRDLYQVGLDVWGVPGDEVRSQAVADAVRSVMVHFGS